MIVELAWIMEDNSSSANKLWMEPIVTVGCGKSSKVLLAIIVNTCWQARCWSYRERRNLDVGLYLLPTCPSASATGARQTTKLSFLASRDLFALACFVVWTALRWDLSGARPYHQQKKKILSVIKARKNKKRRRSPQNLWLSPNTTTTNNNNSFSPRFRPIVRSTAYSTTSYVVASAKYCKNNTANFDSRHN